MDYPKFIQELPGLDVPFPEDMVKTRAVRSDDALVVFFTILKDVDVPEHSHGPQWGAIFEGELEMTISGKTRTYRPGETWDIPDGAPHSTRIRAGSSLMDVFAEPDRYPLKR